MSSKKKVYHLEGEASNARWNATGERCGKKCFKLHKGSLLAADYTSTMPEWALNLFMRLKEQKLISRHGSYSYKTKSDITFDSASAAACVVAGRSENGLDSWVDKDGKSIKENSRNVYFLKTSYCNATGELLEGNKFLVHKGSEISKNSSESHPEWATKIYKRLQRKGIIRKGIMAKRHVFESPSAAACIVTGRSKNGLDEWKNHKGMSLKNCI